MSFSSDVKEELSPLLPESNCCIAAQTYGMLECGHAFSAASISLQTENAAVAQLYRAMVSTVCDLPPEALQQTARAGGLHQVVVEDAKDRLHILERFGHAANDITLRLNRANFDCENCASAYLRGAFLSGGVVTDPNVDYHLELSVLYTQLSRDILFLMNELGLHARMTRRKGTNIVYIKESEQIEDALTMMGAVSASLELMNIKMVKDIRNTANRIANCESANIDKTVTAALTQARAIRTLEEAVGLENLPEDLKEIAQLRLDNPDLSLRELGERLTVPLSRSGVNHRLRRLLEMAEPYL